MKAMMRVVLAAMVVTPMAFGQELVASVPVAVPVGMELQVGTVVPVGMELQVGAVVPVAGGGQVKDDLFAGTEKFAQGASDVTEINLDPKAMRMVPNNGKDAPLAQKMRYMVIHTYKYDKPGMYKPEDVEVYRKKLEDGSWSCSIHVKEKSGTTDICSRETAGKETSEMVILTAEPTELTFIHMNGNMSLDDLSKMGGGSKGEMKMKKREKE